MRRRPWPSKRTFDLEGTALSVPRGGFNSQEQSRDVPGSDGALPSKMSSPYFAHFLHCLRSGLT